MKPLLQPYPAANVVWIDAIDSTNALAERLSTSWEGDEALGETVFVAGAQVRGQGRNGRRWESPRGGLYMTWTTVLPVVAVRWLPVVLPVAVGEAVEDTAAGVEVRIKWPNDLLVQGRKIAGILTQGRVQGERAWIAAGIGVNLLVTPVVAVPEAGRLPVSLAELGHPEEGVWRDIVASFLRRVHARLDEPPAARAAWESRLIHTVGERMVARTTRGLVEGVCEGFGAHGELRLRVGGETETLAAADLLAADEGE